MLTDLPILFEHGTRYPKFAGRTYDAKLDGERLKTQFECVKELMLDGQWRTFDEIRATVKGTETAISARLRDLRKAKFGGYTVESRRRTVGLWEYRVKG